jgi:endonuclease-3
MTKKGPRAASRPRRVAQRFPIDRVLAKLARAARDWKVPVVTLAAEVSGDPFEVLVACILSLRTQDSTTAGAVRRLFSRARTPEQLLALDDRELERLIYPVGFYKTKTKSLKELSRILVEKWSSKVPDEIDLLLELPGVGRKTANLVVTEAFGKPGICVDTHVHRITNRWGYVRTKTPEETETVLRERLPARWWREINKVLVAFGQGICRPTSPRCSECPVASDCPRIGVGRSR